MVGIWGRMIAKQGSRELARVPMHPRHPKAQQWGQVFHCNSECLQATFRHLLPMRNKQCYHSRPWQMGGQRIDRWTGTNCFRSTLQGRKWEVPRNNTWSPEARMDIGISTGKWSMYDFGCCGNAVTQQAPDAMRTRIPCGEFPRGNGVCMISVVVGMQSRNESQMP
jgi:hypothetical protein